MKKPFKLKSGNISGGSSFKAMGATPGESPAKISILKTIGKGLTYLNRLRKGQKASKAGGKLINPSQKVLSYADELKNFKPTLTPKGNWDKASTIKFDKMMKRVSTTNKSNLQKPITYSKGNLVSDLATGGAAYWAGSKYFDKEGMQNVVLPETEVIPYSSGSGKTNEANAVEDKRKNLLDED